MIAARRLARLCVSAPEGSPLEVLDRLLAVQAQDHASALWAVGLRCTATQQAVARALAQGAMVRTWPMRGTLHLLRARDARWMVDLLGPRSLAAQAGRRRQLELDDALLSRCRDRIERALQDGPASREALMAELRSIGVSTDGQRGYHVLVHLAQQGRICQAGPDRNTFALLESFAPVRSPLPRDQALAELARRYFSGHGPATEADLAWWAGLPLGDVRAAIAGAREHLVREEHDGAICWSAAGEEPPPPPGAHLLPAFDELLLGYRDRSAVLDPAHASRVCPGGNGVFRPMVVVGGRVVATWRAKSTRGGVRFAWEPFEGPLDPEALREATARYEGFLQGA